MHKMATVITVANQKGGVTKTTITGVLAFLLGRMDYKVLTVDLDPQSNLTQLLMQVDDVDEEIIEQGRATGTTYEAMIIEDAKPYIVKDVLQNVDHLVSNDELANITSYLYSDEYEGHISECLKNTLASVQNQYHFILVDTPPTLGELLTNGLASSDYAIIPVDTSRYSKSGMKRIFTTIRKIQENVNPQLKVLGIVPNVVNKKRKDSKKSIDELKNHPEYSKLLLPTEIVNKAAIGRLSSTGFENNKEILNEIDAYLPIIEELFKRVR